MIEKTRKQTICTAATEAEKASFQNFCDANGMKPSELLRLLISKVCPQIEAGDQALKKSARKNEQMIIRWHDRDWQALSDKAQSEGISRQEWVRKKVRAVIHKTLPISQVEIRALAESSRELNAIGRNLNQLTRRLNESGGADNQITLAYMQNFAELVEAHTDKVGDVMRAANGRFGEILSD
jgi:predicted HicB family RNase H-like nuclease